MTFIRCASMNGPFLTERAIAFSVGSGQWAMGGWTAHRPPPTTLFRSPFNDELIRAFVVARFVAARRLSPGRNGVASARSLAFTASMRMIHRVHRHAAHRRALAQPPRATGLADRNVLVLDVAHLSDGGHAVDRDDANLARWQPELRLNAVFGDQLREAARASGHLAAFTGFQLDVVNLRAQRNVFDRKRVAGEDVRFGAGNHGLSHPQSGGRNDV